MRFLRGDPYGYQRRVEADMKRKFDEEAAKNEAKPQKSADEIREDRQVFIGLINGVLIGGLLSGVGGIWQSGTLSQFASRCSAALLPTV